MRGFRAGVTFYYTEGGQSEGGGFIGSQIPCPRNRSREKEAKQGEKSMEGQNRPKTGSRSRAVEGRDSERGQLEGRGSNGENLFSYLVLGVTRSNSHKLQRYTAAVAPAPMAEEPGLGTGSCEGGAGRVFGCQKGGEKRSKQPNGEEKRGNGKHSKGEKNVEPENLKRKQKTAPSLLRSEKLEKTWGKKGQKSIISDGKRKGRYDGRIGDEMFLDRWQRTKPFKREEGKNSRQSKRGEKGVNPIGCRGRKRQGIDSKRGEGKGGTRSNPA